jgi:hypothetical protein
MTELGTPQPISWVNDVESLFIQGRKMTYEQAIREAFKKWGGEGNLHLFNVIRKDGRPYHMVGPNVDTLLCERGIEPITFGEGLTWEAAFADFSRKFDRKKPIIS